MPDSTALPVSHYNLEYRGLPAEIRAIIWRFCLIKDVEVHGPYRATTLDDPQAVYDHSNLAIEMLQEESEYRWLYDSEDPNKFHLRGGPNVAVLQLNKQVYQEARMYMKGGIFFDIRKLPKKDQYEFLFWLSPERMDNGYIPSHGNRNTAACGFADMLGSSAPEQHVYKHIQTPLDGVSIGRWMEDMARFRGLTRLLCQIDLDDPLIRCMASNYLHPFSIEPEDLSAFGYDGDIEEYNIELPDVVSMLQYKLRPFWIVSDAQQAIQMFTMGSLRTFEIIFSGVTTIMKRVVHDGGRTLLHFDKLTKPDSSSLRFEAATYSQPGTVHITIKKIDN